MVSIAEDALCFSPAALHVEYVHGGEVRADDFLCSFDDSLKRFPLSLGVVSKPHSDAVGENALNESSVGLDEGLTSESGLLQQPDEIKPLLCFPHCCHGVYGPAQVLT